MKKYLMVSLLIELNREKNYNYKLLRKNLSNENAKILGNFQNKISHRIGSEVGRKLSKLSREAYASV